MDNLLQLQDVSELLTFEILLLLDFYATIVHWQQFIIGIMVSWWEKNLVQQVLSG